MGLLHLETLKNRQNIHIIAHFSRYIKRHGTTSVKFKYLLNYGNPVMYLITKAGKEILSTPDLEEAVNFYNDLYLNL